MKFSDETKRLIQLRAKVRCELCGSPCFRGQFHHRRARGMGGSKRAETGSASNGVLLHPACHEHVERNRAWAKENGWLVSQYLEPRSQPVKRWDGWFLLADDGTLQPFSS